MDLVETAQVLELAAAVVAAPCRLREVDQGALEASDSSDEVKLGGAAGRARWRRVLDTVGKSLEIRKRLGDRARNAVPLGPLQACEQLGDLDPDGRRRRLHSPVAAFGTAGSGSSQACARSPRASL